MKSPDYKISPLLLALIFPPLALGLGACAVGPDFKAPQAPNVKGYTQTEMSANLSAGDDFTTQRLQMGQTVSKQWWQLFHSAELNNLVQLALDNNQTLAAARATLAGAQEFIQQAKGNLYPQIDANARYQREKTSSGANSTTSVINLYAVGASASFAPDVWGGTRRQIERAEALADNQHYQLGAAYLTLTGNVVTQSVTLASLREQLTATEDIVAQDAKNLDLVQKKFEAGKVARLDILTAQSQLANDRTQLPNLRQQINLAQQALTVLVGKFAAEWSPPDIDMTAFTLPADIPVSLPSELVHQRPDILAAEAQFHAASAAVGIADAQMFPSLNLSGAVTTQSLATSSLFAGPNLLWNLAAGITAPLFHGGALNAQRKEAVANFKAAGATYRQTVLQAFGQVAGNLGALQHDAEYVDAQKQALSSASAALKLQQLSYDAGKSDLLHLIDAERIYQQARLGAVRAQSQRLEDTAQLFISMGGGWWNAGEKQPVTASDNLIGKKPD
jgi:NodT family efflux transporter outer membrane factor (OMF) lipoprotein